MITCHNVTSSTRLCVKSKIRSSHQHSNNTTSICRGNSLEAKFFTEKYAVFLISHFKKPYKKTAGLHQESLMPNKKAILQFLRNLLREHLTLPQLQVRSSSSYNRNTVLNKEWIQSGLPFMNSKLQYGTKTYRSEYKCLEKE